jgi:hypothetical protein
LDAIRQFQREQSGRIDEKRTAIKKNYVEKIVSERILEEMHLDPVLADMLHAADMANPFQLADAILQKIKAGGSHDKKN